MNFAYAQAKARIGTFGLKIWIYSREKLKNEKIITLPQNTKYKKQQKGHLGLIERKKSATHLYYGVFGLKILKQCRLIENNRSDTKTNFKKPTEKRKLWIRALPDIPVTSKPKEIRMGKGKGAGAYWVVKVKAGQTLFELSSMGYKKQK